VGWLDGTRVVAKQITSIPDGTQNFINIPAVGAPSNLSGLVEPTGSYGAFARNGYSRNELVYACIAEKAQSLPQSILRVYPLGTNDPIDSHRLRALIETPNPLMGEFELFEMSVTYLDLAGITYLMIERARDGLPAQLWPLRPDLVGVLPSARDPRVFSWVYRPDPGRPHVQVVIPRSDMIAVRYPNPNTDNPADRYFGHPPLRPAARAVSLDNAATDFVDRMLRNDATPTTLVTTAEEINQELVERLRAKWRERFTGSNRGSPAFLQKGMDVKVLGLNLKDLEFPDLRSVSESHICMVFGVPPILVGAKVGLDRSTFANYKEARTSFWDEALASLQRRFHNAFSRLVPEFTGTGRQRIRLRWDNSEVRALQEAETDRWERATNALARGGITINDFRDTVGLKRVSGGDVFLVGAGVVPMPSDNIAPVTGGDGESVASSITLLAAEFGVELTEGEVALLAATGMER
jgi:HK97 family phage portal protein